MSGKGDIITGLLEARRQILEAAFRVPPERRDEVFLGSWSVMDLLAHLVGWDYTNVEAVNDIRAGRAPRVLERWNPDWAAYNAELVRRHKGDEWDELLDAIRQSHPALIEHLQAIPADEVDKDSGIRTQSGANVTIAWWLQFEIDDELEHHEQILGWLE